MGSFHSDSPTNQSESWECPPSGREGLIPDSSTIYDRLASLRSAKKCIETAITSVQAYQVPECSAVGLDSLSRQVVHPSTSAPEIEHEDTEMVGDFVVPENCSVDSAEMGQMANHSIQMEGHNAFEAECIPLEKEPLAEGIQASSNSRPRERADKKKNSKSISMVGDPSSFFSFNLTEKVNMGDNEGDEVNSARQSSPMDIVEVEVEGYQVRSELESTVRKILSKHGDIFKNCTVSSMILRSMLLEMLCDIISDLQDKDLHKITEDELHSIIGLVNEIKTTKVNIEWLHLTLEEILEAKQILNQSAILKEKKCINKKIIENVKRELEECEAKKNALVAKFQAKFQSLCDKETAGKETQARAEDECAKISETITYAKTKVRCFFKCSLADGLL
ncbi:Phospholipase protein [Spatholobus suberectus]|nr:Phospholipase protein [Spatholobus suberectus]